MCSKCIRAQSYSFSVAVVRSSRVENNHKNENVKRDAVSGGGSAHYVNKRVILTALTHVIPFLSRGHCHLNRVDDDDESAAEEQLLHIVGGGCHQRHRQLHFFFCHARRCFNAKMFGDFTCTSLLCVRRLAVPKDPVSQKRITAASTDIIHRRTNDNHA